MLLSLQARLSTKYVALVPLMHSTQGLVQLQRQDIVRNLLLAVIGEESGLLSITIGLLAERSLL